MTKKIAYYKVGKFDDLMKSGRKGISLPGRDFVILSYSKEFMAIQHKDPVIRSNRRIYPTRRIAKQTARKICLFELKMMSL